MVKLLLFSFGFAGLLAAAEPDAVARGKYLVEEVAKCGECHTPYLESGEMDQSKTLKGAVINFAPLHETPKWHKTSPDLTQSGSLWKRWGEAKIVTLLETGLDPKGAHSDAPMPAYHMTHADAVAVVEYLKTLK